MDEFPHRAVIHREAPFAQLGHQAAQRGGPRAAARNQPQAVVARIRTRCCVNARSILGFGSAAWAGYCRK